MYTPHTNCRHSRSERQTEAVEHAPHSSIGNYSNLLQIYDRAPLPAATTTTFTHPLFVVALARRQTVDSFFSFFRLRSVFFPLHDSLYNSFGAFLHSVFLCSTTCGDIVVNNCGAFHRYRRNSFFPFFRFLSHDVSLGLCFFFPLFFLIQLLVFVIFDCVSRNRVYCTLSVRTARIFVLECKSRVVSTVY